MQAHDVNPAEDRSHNAPDKITIVTLGLLWTIFAWLWVLVGGLLSIATYAVGNVTACMFLVVSIVFALPPIFRYLESAARLRISGGVRFVLVLLAVFAAFAWTSWFHRFVSPAPATQTYSPPVSQTSPPTVIHKTLYSDTKLLDEGRFLILPFEIHHAATVTVQVSLKGGPPIDVYLVAEQGMNAWQAAAQTGTLAAFPYIQNMSMAPLSGDYARTGLLSPGTYALVLDNSKFGATSPPFHLFRKTPALLQYEVSASVSE